MKEIKFTELPYHSNPENKIFTYLVSNTPQNKDTLCVSLIKFYKQKPIEFYKTKDISGTNFYKKNRKTSYFINHKDVESIMEYNKLGEYFYGNNGFLKSGLGSILCCVCDQDSTKYIYRLIFFDDDDKTIRLILRDEYTPNWYEQHKDNELVRLFNEGEPFE